MRDALEFLWNCSPPVFIVCVLIAAAVIRIIYEIITGKDKE